MQLPKDPGQRFRIADRGAGLPVLFFPGLAGFGGWFKYQSAGLSDRYRIITWDYSCEKRSPAAVIDDYAADALAVLERVHVHSAVAVGFGFGAHVAAKFAAKHPERCLGLITISTPISCAGMSESDVLKLEVPVEVKFEGFLESLFGRFFRKEKPSVSQDDPLHSLKADCLELNKKALRQRAKAMMANDLANCLANIEAPGYALAGALENEKLLFGAQEICAGMNDCRADIFENIGEYGFFLNYDAFNNAIEEFLVKRRAASH